MFNFASLAILLSYLIGSISPGYLICGFFYQVDPRSIGSTSTGATNAARIGGTSIFILIATIDMLKGAFAVFLTQHICAVGFEHWSIFGVVIGHIFPIGLGFKGGRGVAPYLGAHFMLQSNLIFPALLIALGVKSLRVRKEFQALTLMFFPIFLYFSSQSLSLVLGSFIASLLVVWAHMPSFFSHSTSKPI